MWSGRGIRTLSTDEARYDPVGYHVGSVWPDDNALIADGLGRMGRWVEARRVAEAMAAAAAFQDGRLPEAFAGFDRNDSPFPVRYPMASSPQARATASTFVWIRTMLGLRANGTLRWSTDDAVDGWLQLDDVSYHGALHDIHVPSGSDH
jgi:glycogen debranching enzyme